MSDPTLASLAIVIGVLTLLVTIPGTIINCVGLVRILRGHKPTRRLARKPVDRSMKFSVVAFFVIVSSVIVFLIARKVFSAARKSKEF